MTDALSSYRAEIDALDDQLFALLLQRLDVVERVGLWKQAQGAAPCPIRAAREAAVIKKIAARSAGTLLNPSAAAYIWRHIINASLLVEGSLTLATDAPSHAAALDYFGSYLPSTSHHEVLNVLDAVASGQAMVGVASKDAQDLWRALPHHPDIQVFAALPLLGETPSAYAFAKLRAEASGHDVSLYIKAGQLVQVEGFQPAGEDGIFIGAYSAHKLT